MVEIGYRVDPVHRRRGHGRAALQALLARGAGEPDVRRVRAGIRPDNVVSSRLVLQYGFRQTGEQWDDEDGLELVYEVPAGSGVAGPHGKRRGRAGYAPAMRIIEGAGGWTAPAGAANDWVEHLKVPDLSVGTYCIPAGGLDDQSPHTEDEIYVVMTGRARIVTPDGSADVGPGSVIFVPAGEEHRFAEVAEDLALLVVFGPAYGSRTRGGQAAG